MIALPRSPTPSFAPRRSAACSWRSSAGSSGVGSAGRCWRSTTTCSRTSASVPPTPGRRAGSRSGGADPRLTGRPHPVTSAPRQAVEGRMRLLVFQHLDGRASGRAAPVPRRRRHRLGRGPARPGPADPAAGRLRPALGHGRADGRLGRRRASLAGAGEGGDPPLGARAGAARSWASAWATSCWPTRWAAPAARSARPRSASSRSS